MTETAHEIIEDMLEGFGSPDPETHASYLISALYRGGYEIVTRNDP